MLYRGGLSDGSHVQPSMLAQRQIVLHYVLFDPVC